MAQKCWQTMVCSQWGCYYHGKEDQCSDAPAPLPDISEGAACEIDDEECSGEVTKGCYLGDDLYFCQGHRTDRNHWISDLGV